MRFRAVPEIVDGTRCRASCRASALWYRGSMPTCTMIADRVLTRLRARSESVVAATEATAPLSCGYVVSIGSRPSGIDRTMTLRATEGRLWPERVPPAARARRRPGRWLGATPARVATRVHP